MLKFAALSLASMISLPTLALAQQKEVRWGQWKGTEVGEKFMGELKAAFDAAGVDLDKPLVTTCGSGMTATVVAFGAHLLGKDDVAVYDGSWLEWGSDAATPKATGAA